MGIAYTALGGGGDTEVNFTIPAIGALAPVEIEDVTFSYSGAPAAPSTPNLLVESPAGTVIFQAFVTDAGPGQVRFNSCLRGAIGAGLKVRLLADANGTIGAVNATLRSA